MKSADYDTIIHLSSETETTLRSVNNFLLYFLLWTGGSAKQLTYISMNNLCNQDVVDSGIAKYALGNIRHTTAPGAISNYRDHYLQGYWEVKDGGDYSAVSLKSAYPLTPTAKLKGKNNNWCFITKYKRYSDSKEFYFIQMTQVYGGYFWSDSYRAISELIQYIKKYYPGLYIIVGNFNVQGHEKVFKHFLGEDKYHICPFYKTATCNNEDGITSPDGLVVSKDLYPRIEYGVDFYLGFSYEHFVVKAKLFTGYEQLGLFDTTDQGFKNYLVVLKRTYGERDLFINEDGLFSPTDEQMIGSPSNIRKVEIAKRGPKTLIATKQL